MSWVLKGLAGPLQGQNFPIQNELTLGRQGDVAIPDSKASAIHARIVSDRQSGWLLQDNDSKNGIRADGEKVTQVSLSHGLIFYIGDQAFEVIVTADESPRPEPELQPAVAPAPAPRPREEKRYWYDILASFAQRSKDGLKDRMVPVSTLEPALVLDFVRGVQANRQWILSYGPRKVGPASMDLTLVQPGAPPVCFEIRPAVQGGIQFNTEHPDVVRLNGQSVDSAVLQVGDSIRILDTVIEVDFSE
jgi:hypothetical protein